MLACAATIASGLLRRGWVQPALFDRLAFGVMGATVALIGKFVTAAVFWGPSADAASLTNTPGRIGLALVAVSAILPLALAAFRSVRGPDI